MILVPHKAVTEQPGICVCVCVCMCMHMIYDTDQCHVHSNSLRCVCVFPYNTLCKLFLIGLCSKWV